MTFQSGMYHYRTTFYSGTDNQPHSIQLFIKTTKMTPDGKKEALISHANLIAPVDVYGYIPGMSAGIGVIRIANAVKHIFRALLQINFKRFDQSLRIFGKELGIASGNIVRGLVEIIPFFGNFALMNFDNCRTLIFNEKKIRKSIENEDRLVGIAIDGKVKITIPYLTLFNACKSNTSPLESGQPYYLLGKFKVFCLDQFKAEAKKGSKDPLTVIFDKVKAVIESAAQAMPQPQPSPQPIP